MLLLSGFIHTSPCSAVSLFQPESLFVFLIQGIYRISGAKARMERLCQAFENGRGLVELSDHSPHDITGVLKHFLKEVSNRYEERQL